MKSTRSSKSSQTVEATPAKVEALYNKLNAFVGKLNNSGGGYAPALSKYGTYDYYVNSRRSMTFDEKNQALSLIQEVDNLMRNTPATRKYKILFATLMMQHYGELKLALRDFNGAEACFSEQITHGKYNFNIYRDRSYAREELGNFAGALADLEYNLNNADSKSSTWYKDLAYYHERRGNLPAAIDNYTEAYKRALAEGQSWSLQSAGDCARCAGLLGLALNDFRGAIGAFQSALDKNCYNMQSAQEGMQRAQAGLRNVEDINNGIAAFNRGKEHFAAKYWSEARVSFDAALKKNSRNSEFLYWRGLTNKALQDYPAAILDLESALTLGEKLAQPHLTEIKKIQADLAHQQRVDEDRQRRAMEENARVKQRELENQRRVVEERERVERLHRLEEEKRQQENKRNEQKQREELTAIRECVQQLNKIQTNLKQVSDLITNKEFTELEAKIKKLDTKLDNDFKEQFYTQRGNFYYDCLKKETNQIRKQALFDKALSDFYLIIQFNPFAEGIAEKIEEIKKTKNTNNAVQPKLSAEDHQRIEKKKEELRSKLSVSSTTTAASSSSSTTAPGLFKSTAPTPCNPSQTYVNPRQRPS